MCKEKALIFDEKCHYNAILGANFLTKSGIDINYSNGIIYWFANVCPMRKPWTLDNKEYHVMTCKYII